MCYAFEHLDVPDKADYLEVQYSANYPALPSDLSGETFSRVFGANTSSLEHFLVSRKIKGLVNRNLLFLSQNFTVSLDRFISGPSWLDIKLCTPASPHMSHCKVEALCENPNHVSVLGASESNSSPPLTILTLKMKTTLNPKSMLNEIACVTGLVHSKFYLDKPAPKEDFT